MILRPFKKIKEQEERIEELLEKIDDYRKKEQDREEGKHKTGVWCNGCKNLLTNKYHHPMFGECVDRFCKLDCKCEDRDENNFKK